MKNRTWLIPVVLLVLIFAGQALADYLRLTYMPGEYTVVLHPSGDASVTGSWTVTEGSDVYDELDDPARTDGYIDHDSDGTTANIAPQASGRVELDMENNTGYADANAQIRWVGMRLALNRSDGLTVYNGVSAGFLIASTDYEITAPTTITSAWMIQQPYNNIGYTTETTRYATNPDTGLPWTASDIDNLQIYIDEDADSSATATIYYTEAAVIVNYDLAFENYQVPRQVSGGGD